MNYIKSEFNRVFETKIICFGIGLISLISFIFGRFILGESMTILLGILANVSLIYLIACSSSIATEDFEFGTYKNVYTGRYRFIEVIIMKLIVYMLICLVLSLVVGLISLLNVAVSGESINLAIIKDTILKKLIIYLICGLCMFSFSQLLGLTFKSFSLDLIVMFSLFYGILSELIDLFSRSSEAILSKVVSILPFSIVPKMIINSELSWFNVSISTISALIIILLIKLCEKIWFR
ncbi:MAG: hypothetical protein PUG67_01035 [Peptoniphilaceae bacterium]|nr:hypothetical protein [Peptoniphilaceae bacterium]MDY6018611.1 hypothetical protein [Anaerococcus sp.]